MFRWADFYLVYKRRNVSLESSGDAAYKAARVKEVLGTEMTLRPAASGLEFDSEKVSDLSENTIFNDA